MLLYFITAYNFLLTLKQLVYYLLLTIKRQFFSFLGLNQEKRTI